MDMETEFHGSSDYRQFKNELILNLRREVDSMGLSPFETVMT